MAIADLDTYRARIANPNGIVTFAKSGGAPSIGRLMSFFVFVNDNATAPTSAVVPTSSSTGALLLSNGGSGALRVLGANLQTAVSPGTFILCDRLSHQGGLSGTTTGAQTTNLPTAALSRYTNGAGVMLALDVYSQIGASATTVTASYTNSAGTPVSGQTTATVAIGGTGFRETGRFIPLPLAAGDVGVTACASVTLAATTGTAGNFGVCLFKPLAAFNVSMAGEETTFSYLDGLMGGIPEIVDNACLFWLHMPQLAQGALHGSLTFAED